ncbi:TetR/AcrR family transcriptional regulator [Chryseobacterium sp. Leaf394]|uniref:TetR/AcrR family transcriptional regulator n=1 Tax=Chryseobacterium sp. Leaf394 TaxID=1736361 RepID=UPI0006F70809|nr:TetR/AcrR family transcriptional regulator [Chryseobacterium sp. Leaf394]KQS91699.1 hypothetical protein ASG21_04355 [Chryseobacterium sp. Leaf394]
MGSKERILKKKAEVARSILDVALHILTTEGIDGISMRKIASRIEYSLPVIYAHYRSKEIITDRLTDIGFLKLRKQMERSVANSEGPSPPLEKMLTGYVEFALENKSLYLLMSRKSLEKLSEEHHRSEAEKLAVDFKSVIKNSLPAQRKKSENEIDTVYYGMISLVHGIITVSFASGKFYGRERDLIISKFVKAIIE